MTAAARATLAALLALATAPAPAGEAGRAPFDDPRRPPAFAPLDPAAQARFDLGLAVFNTQWAAAPAARAGRRDGLGPFFNAAACDACHNNGARARPPLGAGPAPSSMVVRLAAGTAPGTDGDPGFGRILSPNALEEHAGLLPEATLVIDYIPRSGRYADGGEWMLREPRYRVTGAAAGRLAPGTIVRPRIAPAVFGVGLLERIPEADLVAEAARQAAAGKGPAGSVSRPADAGAAGRFGWQAAEPSVRSQTTGALALDMGLTSAEVPADDCAPAQAVCRSVPSGGAPEAGADLVDALVAFQQALAVPASLPGADPRGSELFAAAGCDGCHRPAQRAVLDDGRAVEIRPYTDLLVHDLGEGLADRTADGRVAPGGWRTAPLWGLGHAPRPVTELALLHDGRARSVEEAILWHDGEARAARRAFAKMGTAEREALAGWVQAR